VAELPGDPRPEKETDVIAVQSIAGFWPIVPWCSSSIINVILWLSSFILHHSSLIPHSYTRTIPLVAAIKR
jgi:hypothetical protein